MARLTWLLARASLAVLPVALLGACAESGPRIYTARLYRGEAGCLEPYAALGLVQSRALGAECEPNCLRLDGALYVSPVCPPYPARATLEAADSPECAAALAALSQSVACDPSPRDAAVADAGGGLMSADAEPRAQ